MRDMADIIRAAENIARLEGQVEGIDRDLRAHLKSCIDAQKETQDRFRVVERLIYTAIGGLMVIGTMVGMYGHKIMKVLVG